jgi:hypothetical protein
MVFNALSLFSMLIVLTIVFRERFHLVYACLVSLRLPVTEQHLFLKIREIFCYYFVEYISYNLVYNSSPSLMIMM